MANQIRPYSMCLLLNILFVSKADSEMTNQLQFLHQMILRVEQIKKKKWRKFLDIFTCMWLQMCLKYNTSNFYKTI